MGGCVPILAGATWGDSTPLADHGTLLGVTWSAILRHPTWTTTRCCHRTPTLHMTLQRLKIPREEITNMVHDIPGDDSELDIPTQTIYNTLSDQVTKCNAYRLAMVLSILTLEVIIYHLRKKGLENVWRPCFSF